MNSIDLALSPDMDPGLKKGISAPYRVATSAISSESVETTTLSTSPSRRACIAGSMVYAIRGFPLTSMMFFLGIPFDPPLAGIMVRSRSLFFMI